MNTGPMRQVAQFVLTGLAKYHALDYLNSSASVLKELFWPTRCAVCDAPGALICPTCLLELEYLDYWKQCSNCGGPFGILQCCECNIYSLQVHGIKKLPYETCLSLVFLTRQSSCIVLSYKDSNEKRLAFSMARLMARIVPPAWLHEQPAPVLAYIPASETALRKRGFDHGEVLARELADALHLSYTDIFQRPHSKDQRKLGKKQRVLNMRHGFEVKAPDGIPPSIIAVDDVYTTGATLISVCSALQSTCVRLIRCLTFARTP